MSRKARRAEEYASEARGFNGAATLVSRKEAIGYGQWKEAGRLQWGRDFSVAEGAASLPPNAAHVALQWGRDFSVAEGGCAPGAPPCTRRFNGAATLVSRKAAAAACAWPATARRFNGAATLVSRKGEYGNQDDRHGQASMGPRL